MTVFIATDFSDHEHVSFVHDRASGLRAIVAVHNTHRGPAIGGCRVWEYPHEAAALRDVLRLSRGMTYKAAVANVPFGGGKTVVLSDPQRPKSPAMMHALGRAIERLGGSYITGEDVGTTVADMARIREVTDKVMGMPVEAGGSGDPSRSTARGCFVGILASVRHAMGVRDPSGLRVAVQGLGNVGYELCRMLNEAGAQLIVSDLDHRRTQRCEQQFGATVVAPQDIHQVDADVFAPCAMGAILTPHTIAGLRVRVVAGGANNQLETPQCGNLLRERKILYAPDYVINAGGLIQLSAERMPPGSVDVAKQVDAIGATLLELYSIAEAQGIPTHVAADRLAEQRFMHSQP